MRGLACFHQKILLRVTQRNQLRSTAKHGPQVLVFVLATETKEAKLAGGGSGMLGTNQVFPAGSQDCLVLIEATRWSFVGAYALCVSVPPTDFSEM